MNLRELVLKYLESEPLLYGSDIGNPSLIREVLKKLKPNGKIKDLTLQDISISVAVSRLRNKILEERPDLDFREIYAINRNEKEYITLPFEIFRIKKV